MAAALWEDLAGGASRLQWGAFRSVLSESGKGKNVNSCSFLLKLSIIMDLMFYSKLPPLDSVSQQKHHFLVAPGKSQL